MIACVGMAGATELLDILRMAIDTRKVPLVDIALDLLQKLMAYQYLAGRVFSISHKRDPHAKTLGKAAAAADDEDEDVSASEDMPPQVPPHPAAFLALSLVDAHIKSIMRVQTSRRACVWAGVCVGGGGAGKEPGWHAEALRTQD